MTSEESINLVVSNKIQQEKLSKVTAFLDMLFESPECSKLFKSELVELRCEICDIHDCSVRGDRYECLRLSGGK